MSYYCKHPECKEIAKLDVICDYENYPSLCISTCEEHQNWGFKYLRAHINLIKERRKKKWRTQ